MSRLSPPSSVMIWRSRPSPASHRGRHRVGRRDYRTKGQGRRDRQLRHGVEGNHPNCERRRQHGRRPAAQSAAGSCAARRRRSAPPTTAAAAGSRTAPVPARVRYRAGRGSMPAPRPATSASGHGVNPRRRATAASNHNDQHCEQRCSHVVRLSAHHTYAVCAVGPTYPDQHAEEGEGATRIPRHRPASICRPLPISPNRSHSPRACARSVTNSARVPGHTCGCASPADTWAAATPARTAMPPPTSTPAITR